MPLLEFRRVLLDRKSTRLNSSHTLISYAVFCFKKKTDAGTPRRVLLDVFSQHAQSIAVGIAASRFFFLMNRRPPRSTLFPNTTLFRSIVDGRGVLDPGRFTVPVLHIGRPPGAARSEEHTSELQSHSHLVCRLLLEKKKTREETTRAHDMKKQIHTA